MVESLVSPEVFPGAFAFLTALYVFLKLVARQWPGSRRARPRPASSGQTAQTPQDTEALLALATRAPTREVQIAAIHCLAERRVREAIPVLGRLLRGSDPLVASEAANGLGAIGDPAALAYLEAATSALDRELKESMDLPGVARLGGSRVAPESPPWQRIAPELSRNNYRAFDKYGPHDIRSRAEDEIVEMLLTMAANTDEPVATRFHAIKSLERFRSPVIAGRLPPLLDDESTTVRYTAAEVIATHGSEESIGPLLARLEDPNRYVRSSAAMTLAVLGSDRAIGPLMKLKDDPEDVVRYSADKALDSIGKKKRIASLLTRRERAG